VAKETHEEKTEKFQQLHEDLNMMQEGGMRQQMDKIAESNTKVRMNNNTIELISYQD
jgi:hypothetical protein